MACGCMACGCMVFMDYSKVYEGCVWHLSLSLSLFFFSLFLSLIHPSPQTTCSHTFSLTILFTHLFHPSPSLSFPSLPFPSLPLPYLTPFLPHSPKDPEMPILLTVSLKLPQTLEKKNSKFYNVHQNSLET